MNGDCYTPEERKEYNQAYRRNNAEKLKQLNADQRRKRKKKISAINNKYRKIRAQIDLQHAKELETIYNQGEE